MVTKNNIPRRNLNTVLMAYSITVLMIFSLLLGPLSHRAYFMKGEHHLKAPFYFRTLLIAVALCSFSQVHNILLGNLWPNRSLIFIISYLASLLCSITTYRLFLHPIRNYPGPRLVAISKLWHSWLALDSQNHRLLTKWHEKYGEFVRTGPNEITVFHAEALEALHGLRSSCSKTDWYDILRPHVAINTTRDKIEHEVRRKVWNPSFSKEVLPGYDTTYQKHNHRFETVIRQHLEREVNIVEIIYRWSFDAMGDVTFSKSFQTLTHTHSRDNIETLRRFLGLLGPCSPTPWLITLGASIPGVMDSWNEMFDTCKGYMMERIEMNNSKRPDIASRIADSLKDKESTYALSGDAVAMVIAGSDTLACTLVYALFHLAATPSYQDRILDELKEYHVSGGNSPDPSSLQRLPFLSAFINETLRLHSPVPTGTPRNTGPEGLTIAGRYIPPFTTVVAPRYHIARLPYCFHNATMFDPSRWMGSNEKGPHDTRAFAPFGAGRYGCIGRGLAMRQARAFLATMVSKFRIELAEGEDGIAVERDMRDEFTAVPGPVLVRFSVRPDGK